MSSYTLNFGAMSLALELSCKSSWNKSNFSRFMLCRSVLREQLKLKRVTYTSSLFVSLFELITSLVLVNTI